MKKNLYITLWITWFIVLSIVLFTINNSQETQDSFSTQSVRLNVRGSVSKSEGTARKMIDTSNTPAICGNWIKEAGEQCDGKWQAECWKWATCVTTWKMPCTCQYNEVVNPEIITDNNDTSIAICGNWIVELAEECDSWDKDFWWLSLNNKYYCSNNCTILYEYSCYPEWVMQWPNKLPSETCNNDKECAIWYCKKQSKWQCLWSAPCPQITDETQCKSIWYCSWWNIDQNSTWICTCDGY